MLVLFMSGSGCGVSDEDLAGEKNVPVTVIDPTQFGIINNDYKVFALNRRGMAFPDQDFSVYAIFPPANFLKAQVIRTSHSISEMPVLLDDNTVSVRYSAIPDANGSINSSSADKTNFWQYADKLYSFILPAGVSFQTDEGIFGAITRSQHMPGTLNTPQPFNIYDPVNRDFTATWVPVLPVDDDGKLNYFPMMRVDAYSKSTGSVLAATDIVLPVAKPMDCAACHATGGIAANDTTNQRHQNSLVWSTRTDRDNQGKENVVVIHEARNGRLLNARLPVMCAECHYSPVADPDGVGPSGTYQPRRRPLSIAIHAAHGLNRDYILPANNTDQNIPENGNDSCMYCHGRDAPYLRDAMNKAGITCQDCHGGMLAVAKSPMVGAAITRTPFIDEPRCESCHTGDVYNFLGNQLVLTRAYDDAFATPRIAINRRYAEEPGKLFRQSVGHGGVACQSCHGSPHAVWSNQTPGMRDNIIPAQLQGHGGTISDCVVCHQGGVALSLNGPHGLHNINDPEWVKFHGNFYTFSPVSACQACHGDSLQGTHLSGATSDRVFETASGGSIAYASGEPVGCGDCHVNPALN